MRCKCSPRRAFLLICGVFCLLAGIILIGHTAAAKDDAQVTASGTTGTVTWTLYDDGVLCFEPKEGESGTLGTYTSFTGVPWYSYRASITSIESAEGIIAGESLDYFFYGCSKITGLSGISSWDVSNVTSADHLFAACGKLADLSGISGWKMPYVTDFSYMFYNCKYITSLDALSEWDTSSVEDFSYMFYSAIRLEDAAGLTGWDLSSAVSAASMFYDCEALETLDLSGWDTSGLADVSYMFYKCDELTTVYVSSLWSTDSVTADTFMFGGCSSLTGSYGTGYSSSHTDCGYARIDSASRSGYFTEREWDTYRVYYYPNTLYLNLSGSMESQYETYGADAVWYLSACTWKYAGYTFTGWNTAADGSGDTYQPEDAVSALAAAGGTVQLFAQWTCTSWFLAFDANGGTGSMSGQSIESGQAASIAANAFRRTGYSFAGWNTAADGSGTSYADGETVKDLLDIGETMTLYAQWEKLEGYYISEENYYDPEEWTDEEGNVTPASEVFPASEYSGYWTKLSDDTWAYVFYTYEEDEDYYVWEDVPEGYTGDYTIQEPYVLESGGSAVITNTEDENALTADTALVSTGGRGILLFLPAGAAPLCGALICYRRRRTYG